MAFAIQQLSSPGDRFTKVHRTRTQGHETFSAFRKHHEEPRISLQYYKRIGALCHGASSTAKAITLHGDSGNMQEQACRNLTTVFSFIDLLPEGSLLCTHSQRKRR